DELEANPEYRDADKLALKDVLSQLAAHLDEEALGAPYRQALLQRIGEDRAALNQIQALYAKELQNVLSRLATRGMPVRRESWESYIAFVRTRFDRSAVLRELDQVPLEQPESRGRRPAKPPRMEL